MKEKVGVERLGGITLWGTLKTITMNLDFTKYIERRNHKFSNRGLINRAVQISQEPSPSYSHPSP